MPQEVQPHSERNAPRGKLQGNAGQNFGKQTEAVVGIKHPKLSLGFCQVPGIEIISHPNCEGDMKRDRLDSPEDGW